MEFVTQMRIPGPNRRCEEPILEHRLVFREYRGEHSPLDGRVVLAGIDERLERMGVTGAFDPFGNGVPGDIGPQQQAMLFVRLALFLQQQAGHEVSEHGAVPDAEGHFWAWFEYDHTQVGQAAARLSLAMIRDALGQAELEPGDAVFSTGRFNRFLEFARPLCQSAETRALVSAARRRDIPCFNLDRYPYDPLQGDFRLRPNGLLRLGHAHHQYVLDGTLCVNRDTQQVMRLRDPRGLRMTLQAAGVAWESEAPAVCLRVLVIDDEPVACLRNGEVAGPATIDAVTARQISAVCREFRLPIFSADISAGGSWSNVDLAPRLDSWFPPGDARLDQAADRLLGALYPAGRQFRIPIISVTGTNGKTTTCTMLGHILSAAKQSPVVVSSTGVWLDQKMQGKRGNYGAASAYYALEAPDARIAVFEDYFGSIIHFGFAYQWCDVAVCTNVSVDHLHHMGAHTLEDLAEIKFAPVRRARSAVVLNADNAACAAMLPRSQAAKKVAVSMQLDRETLFATHESASHACVLETEAGREFIVLYDAASRHVLLATEDIPATMGGLARHNVSNAMHAAAAAWMAGTSPEVIATALGSYVSTIETCRGRLNDFRGLPFRVILDYAHNADGFRMMSEFMDGQEVSGRKTILARFTSDRRPNELREAMRELAGHFDQYVCTEYPSSFRIVQVQNITGLMQAAFLEYGVEPEAIKVIPDPEAALDWTLQQARAGDVLLLLLSSDEFEKVWQRLAYMQSRGNTADKVTA